MDTPGVEVVRRCHFMGLRALYNGVIRFTDVKVPRENILLAEGEPMQPLTRSIERMGKLVSMRLRDVLERLPTQPASRIDELLPHRWRSRPLH